MILNKEKNTDTKNSDLIISPKLTTSRFGEYYLASVNRKSFEVIDSRTLYNKKFKEEFEINDNLNIIIGSDSGLLIKYIMEKSIPKGSKFIFIELHEVLNILSIEIPNKYKKTITICNENNFIKYFKKDSFDIYFLKNKCTLHPSIAVSHEHIENYTHLYNKVKKIIESIISEHQISFSQQIFTKAQFENISEMIHPAKILKSILPNRTAIIIGGGPSMDEHIDWIKINRANLVILAVSRIADKLILNDIIPDFVITVDPQDISFDVNSELMKHFDKFILIFSYHACPRIVNQWQGKCMYLGNKYPWEEEGNIPTIGPTVSNSSIRIALEMGCTQILLSGVDFCYSQSGYTHVKGTLEANLGPNLGQIGEWVETNGGLKAETPIQLLYALDALQSEVALYNDVDFVNLSINAAKINGVRYCPIENIILKDTNNISNIISNIHLSENRMDVISKTINNVQNSLNKLSTLLEKINSAIELVKKMDRTEISHKELMLHSREISKIEKNIQFKFPELISLAKNYGLYEISKSLSLQDSNDWDQNTVNSMHRIYFSALKESINALIKLSSDSLERLKSRMIESEGAELSRLFPQWKNDNQPGRVLIWLKNVSNKEIKLTKSEMKLIELLKNDYKNQVNKKNLNYENKIKNSNKLESIFRKASYFIENKDISGLYYLLSCLNPVKNKNKEIRKLSTYIEAKALELENKFNLALNKILEIPINQCTEYELKLTIKLALKNSNLPIAERYLVETLKISKEFMPQYAHLLQVEGRLKESLNVYLDYLEEYPSDVPIWLKLGTFMLDLEQIESARFAFSQALIADPKNIIAIEFIEKINTHLLK